MCAACCSVGYVAMVASRAGLDGVFGRLWKLGPAGGLMIPCTTLGTLDRDTDTPSKTDTLGSLGLLFLFA